jgi:hypothetical protein
MNLNALRALKAPLAALIAVIAIGASLLYYIDFTLTSSKRALAQQQSQLRDARARLQKSRDENEIIARYLDSYQYLQRVGLIGDEQRLNWLDAIRFTNQQTRSFGVDYQIGTQQPYPYASELDPGQLTLHQSVMKLNLRLLHEGDLMRFLSTLAQQGVGVFSVDQCMMQRVDIGGSARNQPNVRADCDLTWITLRPPGAAGDGKS